MQTLWSHSVAVITRAFEARDPSSNLGGTSFSVRGAVVALAPPEGMDGGSNPPGHP